jgi:hypothetical protein
VTSNPQYDPGWAAQAALFVEVHLDELIAMAGGAEIDEAWREHASPLPADFPAPASPANTAEATGEREAQQLEIGAAMERACRDLPEGFGLEIWLEKDAGTITLHLPDTDATDDQFDRDTFGGQINEAIEFAIERHLNGEKP